MITFIMVVINNHSYDIKKNKDKVDNISIDNNTNSMDNKAYSYEEYDHINIIIITITVLVY